VQERSARVDDVGNVSVLLARADVATYGCEDLQFYCDVTRPAASAPNPPTTTSAMQEPYALGSFDDVVLAYDLGQLTDADYEVLILAGHPERDDLAPGAYRQRLISRLIPQVDTQFRQGRRDGT
jgi:hypothetical protein